MAKYGIFRELDSGEFYRLLFELGPSICIQQRRDRIDLSVGTPSDLLTSGRAFNHDVELRWDEGRFAVLREADTTEDVPSDAAVYHCDERPFPVLLWQDASLRHKYPGGITQIQALKYLKDGIVRFIRFKGVK